MRALATLVQVIGQNRAGLFVSWWTGRNLSLSCGLYLAICTILTAWKRFVKQNSLFFLNLFGAVVAIMPTLSVVTINRQKIYERFYLTFALLCVYFIWTQSEGREMKQTTEQIIARWRLLNHRRCDLINNSSYATRPAGLSPVGRQACNYTHTRPDGLSWWLLLVLEFIALC